MHWGFKQPECHTDEPHFDANIAKVMGEDGRNVAIVACGPQRVNARRTPELMTSLTCVHPSPASASSANTC
jgi:hypothetical protein